MQECVIELLGSCLSGQCYKASVNMQFENNFSTHSKCNLFQISQLSCIVVISHRGIAPVVLFYVRNVSFI